MMKSKIISLATGVMTVLAVGILLVVLPATLAQPSSYPANSSYFVQEDSSGEYCENNTIVQVRFNYTTVSCGATDFNITFDPNCVNITAADYTNSAWGMPIFEHDIDNVHLKVCDFGGVAPDDHLVANITLHCIKDTNDCTSDLNFTNLVMVDVPWGNLIDTTPYNGTFTCGAVETFNKNLYEGWNLVSLPLTPEDSSTNAVLGSLTGNYENVYKYDTSSHGFVQANTMNPGTGYFINMTADDTWTYEGSAYTSMAVSQEQGLNMVGWLNCTQDNINDALSSIEGSYRYLARWNTSLQNYEVYVPGAPEIFHEFSVLTRGEGYFIAAKQSCTLEASCPG